MASLDTLFKCKYTWKELSVTCTRRERFKLNSFKRTLKVQLARECETGSLFQSFIATRKSGDDVIPNKGSSGTLEQLNRGF